MAKRNDSPNKSQAIREMLQQNPGAKAKDIVAGLAQRGIQVKPSLVYMIKGRLLQMRSHKDKRAANVARMGKRTGNADPVALVLRVKALAKEAGGIHNLKNLVTALAD